MNTKGIEKRLFPRKLVRTKVVFEDEFGEGLIYLYTENISLGGLFLTSYIPIKVGSYIFLSFCLPNSKVMIRGTGQVMRVSKINDAENTEDKDNPEGLGIRFVGLSQESVDVIREYVS